LKTSYNNFEVKSGDLDSFSASELASARELFIEESFNASWAFTSFNPYDLYVLALADRKCIAARKFKAHQFMNFQGLNYNALQCCDTVTAKAWRRQGLSRLLLEEGVRKAREEYQFLFNFPNEQSLPGYLRAGFKIFDQNITALTWEHIDNQITDETCFDAQIGDPTILAPYKLRNGLLSKIPFWAFGSARNTQKRPVFSLRWVNLSMNSMMSLHEKSTIKLGPCLIRPITFFPINDFDIANLQITAASLDTRISL